MRIEEIEDRIIVKKIQEAPERTVYYIDVGNLSPKKAMEYIEKVKKEIRNKKWQNKK